MIRLDHDGHEVSRDLDLADPDQVFEAMRERIQTAGYRVHVRRDTVPGGYAGGYWDRLHEDMRQAREAIHPPFEDDGVFITDMRYEPGATGE